jgi:uncharacterized protein YkwD
VEETGVYRWTDPNEPDRRPERPTDEGPAWLTGRPEPRSSYLFGDESEQPAPYPADAPTQAWHPAPADEPWRYAPPGAEPADHPSPGTGRHRQQRRFRRPLVIGGAAAAATLVVSLGVGALMQPGSDEQTESTSADSPIAAAPAAPGTSETPGEDVLPTPSLSASPSSLRPSPSRSATPRPSRTTAPSRQLPRSSTSTGATPRGATSGTITAELQQVVDLVNQERAKAGCKALAIDDKLMLAAQRHSQDQADHQTMSHDGSDGSDVGDRLDRVGYSWRAYGENVAWNQRTPAAVMDAWMNSSGHRANILNCSFTEIGVGVARSNGPYWTQDFGTPR